MIDMLDNTVIKMIGNTPLIKLKKLSEPNCAEIYVKYEGGNPTGSMKDRMALSMIEGAERRGELTTGGKVVEYTGGSTGSSLAMVCATKGYQAHFVSSDAFAEEKLRTMRAFGADLEIIPSENGVLTAKLIDDIIARAKELSKAPNTFLPTVTPRQDDTIVRNYVPSLFPFVHEAIVYPRQASR